MKVKILPYKMYSQSAKRLAEQLQLLRVWPKKWKPKQKDLVINWGNSKIPAKWLGRDCIWLNHPLYVSWSCNKLTTLKKLQEAGVSIPPFTEDVGIAHDWIEEGETVLARTLLRSHSGKGIHIITDHGSMVDAPLYTKYMKKKDEYRVHIFDGNIIDVQQKKQSKEAVGNTHFQVRNHGNGWVYCRDGIDPPQIVLDESVKAITAIGLDFGCVDIGYNEYYHQAVVYEVNSAAGLFGTTLNKYVDEFQRVIDYLTA